MFDIKAQGKAGEVEDGGTFVHLFGLDEQPAFFKDADGKDQPVGITVAGTNSRQYRQIESMQRNRRLKPKDLTGAKMLEDSVERVAFCAISWQGFQMDGAPVQFSKENVKVLLKECPWLLDQITEAMQDHSRFSRSGSKS